MTMIIDGTNGLTFNNATTQASAGLVAGGTIASGTITTLTTTSISDGTNSTSSTNAIQGSAKAWVKFSVNTGGTVTINGFYNMSSVTRNSQGNYTFVMTNALANANYSVVTSQGLDPTNGTVITPTLFWNGSDVTPTTTTFVVKFVAPSNGVGYDPKVCGLVVNN